MMLLNPSAGEIVDRLTILELKIRHSGKRDITEWTAEHEILKKKMEFMIIETRESYVANGVGEYYDSLQAVNTQLWEAEDELRTYPEPYWSSNNIVRTEDGAYVLREGTMEEFRRITKLALCAYKIAMFNDKRMGLVREINTLFNQKGAAQGAQKIYSGAQR